MSSEIESKLRELGVELPQAAAPAANYAPYVLHGDTLMISGQLPMQDGKVAQTGTVGDGVSIEEAQAAARLCAINILAQAKSALGGDLGRIVKVARLNGFVNSAPDFGDHPQVINGASDLMADALGDAGVHSRIAVGVAALPFDASVEIDAMIYVK